jgi:Protein of unknown function (DUF1549)/Protein of unknown function (DUF1553)
MPALFPSCCRGLVLILVLLIATGAARAETPLHQEIDQAVAAALPNKLAAGPASDADFLRRIYLDLAGMIPTATEARAFFQDASPDKRSRLVDRLLASPEHFRHMANVLDVMLMERRPVRNVPQAAWLEYLRESVAVNKPWDQLVREILSADGGDPKQRHLARFLLDRDGDPNLLTKDISRLLLGMNLQCAQCHDHPRVEDYKQEYYYGLFAYLNRTQLIKENASKQTVLGEKADGEVSFQSVFDPAKTTKTSGPRMPYAPAGKEPSVEKGKEYVVAPAPGVRSVPRYSRRAQLAPQLARPDHVAFKRNIANRLWALMMGRGLVHPLDMDHAANPASHPELLTLLADDIAAHKFDMRYFLRELALSQTYQRSSEPPAGLKDVEPGRYAVALLKPLSPEQLAWSLMQASGVVENTRKALGAQATEAAVYGRLNGNVGPFVNTFAGAVGMAENFDARLEQALFLANGPTVRSWLAPTPGNLTARLATAPNNEALADDLYLSVFTRLPTAEERKDTADFLAGRQTDRPRALQDLVWAQLTSAEFRFNH